MYTNLSYASPQLSPHLLPKCSPSSMTWEDLFSLSKHWYNESITLISMAGKCPENISFFKPIILHSRQKPTWITYQASLSQQSVPQLYFHMRQWPHAALGTHPWCCCLVVVLFWKNLVLLQTTSFIFTSQISPETNSEAIVKFHNKYTIWLSDHGAEAEPLNTHRPERTWSWKTSQKHYSEGLPTCRSRPCHSSFSFIF